VNDLNGEFYWGTIRGRRVGSCSGTIQSTGDSFDIERYEAALVERYGAPMLFKVTQLGEITAINGYDPQNMPEIPAVMLCISKIKDLPEDEPVLGSPLFL
jgi:hypothetical protein